MKKSFARITVLLLLAGGLIAMTADDAEARHRRARRFACHNVSHCCHSQHSHYGHSHGGCCGQTHHASYSGGCGTGGCGVGGCGINTCCGYSQGTSGCCATGGHYAQGGQYHSQQYGQQYGSNPTPYQGSTQTDYYGNPMPPGSTQQGTQFQGDTQIRSGTQSQEEVQFQQDTSIDTQNRSIDAQQDTSIDADADAQLNNGSIEADADASTSTSLDSDA